jgi:hypothetical protein
MHARRTRTLPHGPSLLQMSALQRLGLAVVACALVWAVIGWALL